ERAKRFSGDRPHLATGRLRQRIALDLLGGPALLRGKKNTPIKLSETMLTIDGSYQEGGGQILRTALALSVVTQTPFRIEKIRAGRKTPGLMRQHLTAVNAAAAISQAEVVGNAIGSQELTFSPGKVLPGEYSFSVGTAGSTTLVFQTVLPALLLAAEPSRLTLEGGTHNPAAPPYDFLEKAFLPLLRRMGARVSTTLKR